MEPRPPRIQRAPRLRPPLPDGETELPAPGAAPTQPQFQITTILLSLLPGLLGAGVTLFVAHGSPGYLLYSLPVMLGGAAVQLLLFWLNRRRWAKAIAQRATAYRARLAEAAAAAQERAERQRAILLAQDPGPQEYIARVEGRESRLWGRSPADPDFLAARLGLGALPASHPVRPPRATPTPEDPLHQEAVRLAQSLQSVDALPLCLRLPSVSATGLVGPRSALLSTLRAFLLQVVTHHGPEHLQVAALFPAAEAGEWGSLRWLPHVWDPEREGRFLACTPEGAQALLTRLQEGLPRDKEDRSDRPHLLLLVGDTTLAPAHPAWRRLCGEGIHLLFLADRQEALPPVVSAILVAGADGRGELLHTQPHLTRAPLLVDQLDGPTFDRVARALAPCQPAGSQALAIPRQVDFRSLWGAPGGWATSRPWESLAVAIGRGAGGAPLMLDLHERGDGPHGLVAGTTGSGKSELLQTLIAGLARSFHPHELAFLLVDYKGGGMAGGFAGLPHLAGLITNLAGNLADRALASLRAELRRRQRILAEASLTHVDAYIRLRRAEPSRPPLPHLLLIVDEFAELKAEQPAFMRELVSAVRVGRSLGVHLLLATQKPAGIVDEQIWSNARFRLALRVERREDSMEVLKSPVAAALDRPGLAWLQVGSGERMELFQAGWGGAPDRPTAGSQPAVAEVGLGGERYPLGRPIAVAESGQTQLAALVDQIRAAAVAEGIEPVPAPWLPPLPEQIDLTALKARGTGWGAAPAVLAPIIGLIDQPAMQAQEPLRLPLTKEGHLLVVGAPGSGKSTLLLTLALSLAGELSPIDLHLYAIDGAGRALLPLAGLPHMGASLLIDETERLRRLARRLQGELAARRDRIGQAGAASWQGYRQLTGDPLPAILLLVDNLPALLAAAPEWEELLALLGREGAPLGIHLALTSASYQGLRAKLVQSIGLTIALQLHDRSDYPAIVGRTEGLVPAPLPGRGLIRGQPPLEFQTALPVAGGEEWERTAALQSQIRALAAAWDGPRPEPVMVLPERVALRSLPMNAPLTAAVGLEVEGLTPFRLSLADGPHFLVSGPPGSGKSTLLQSTALALQAGAPDALQIWLADLGGSGLGRLAHLPGVVGVALEGAAAGAQIEAIGALLAERRQQPESVRTAPALLLIADDIDIYREALPSAARDRLEGILRRERGLGFHLLIAGGSGCWQSGYDGLTKALREVQTGFLLGTADPGEGALFGVRLPPAESRFLSPGLGFYIRRGRIQPVKIALPDHQVEEEEQYDAHSSRDRAVAHSGSPAD